LNEIKEPFRIPNFHMADRNINYLYKYDFISGLDEKQFYSIWYFIDKESERSGSDIIKLEPVNIKEVHYRSGIRKGFHYKNGVEIKRELIKKEDKMHINIKDGGNDFRITSCKENEFTESDIPYDDSPTTAREKFRTSYKFGYFRLDFTIVTTYKDANSDNISGVTYELEFEFAELSHFLEAYKNSYEDFRKIFYRFIQNISCFYIASTSEFHDSRFFKPKNKYDSLFGDYIEKNIRLDSLNGMMDKIK
jgi:hypothetical protein